MFQIYGCITFMYLFRTRKCRIIEFIIKYYIKKLKNGKGADL